MKLNYFLALSILWIASSCSIEPEPVKYGTDNCAVCEMTIMDQRYGTEVVTDKGKIYKFDSVECLVRYLKEKDQQVFSHVLVTSFDKPDKLVDAKVSFVLHCKEMPSPMGMFLTAFDNKEVALQYQQEKGGEIYQWDELIENFSTLR